MNKDELQYIKENYFDDDADLKLILEMIDEVQQNLFLLSEETQQRDITLKLPIIRLSEKMWGKEGTEDRAIIENLLQKIIGQGGTLSDRLRSVSNFITSPPQTDDISEILSYIVLLDTLTNIMLHFNASAAGFTFEGFLAALLKGEQIAAGAQAGIQDIIDNDKSPISLKLLTEEGSASVEGSYKDLCDHFIDPGGLKQDPESGEYVGDAGAEGKMTYVVALKSWRDMRTQETLEGEGGAIRFYQFDFNAENFLDAMRSNPHNARLLLLPEDLRDDPTDDLESTHLDSAGSELSPEEFIATVFGPDDLALLGAAGKNKLMAIALKYDTDYARELFSQMTIIPAEGGQRSGRLVWAKDNTEFRQPSRTGQLPWEPAKGSERLKNVGPVQHERYLDFAASIRLLEQALAASPEKFWGLVARTLGYAGGVKGVTQFDINRTYYERKSYDADGIGFVAQIPVGRKAVTYLAQKYVDVLNQQIFDLFERVELLANQINAYFVGGDKAQGLEAARTAGQIEKRQRRYVKRAEETFPPESIEEI
jgi:hypothetical protein